MRDPALWERLRDYRFDDPDAEVPFSQKLQRSEGWTRRATARIIDEYRRFLYLATISDAKVTPSRKVDRVWHLHLTYTEDYWHRLCAILGGELHHKPSTGPEEDAKYLEQYRDTIALYEQEFGDTPERAIWPRPPRSAKPKSLGWLGGFVRLILFFGIIFFVLTRFFVGVPLVVALVASAVGAGILLAMSMPGAEGVITLSTDSGGGDGDGGDGGGCGD